MQVDKAYVSLSRHERSRSLSRRKSCCSKIISSPHLLTSSPHLLSPPPSSPLLLPPLLLPPVSSSPLSFICSPSSQAAFFILTVIFGSMICISMFRGIFIDVFQRQSRMLEESQLLSSPPLPSPRLPSSPLLSSPLLSSSHLLCSAFLTYPHFTSPHHFCVSPEDQAIETNDEIKKPNRKSLPMVKIMQN
eukprot:764797-Hanusia_phi.AAC.3